MRRLLAAIAGWIRERRAARQDWPVPGDQDVMGAVRTLRRLHDPGDFAGRGRRLPVTRG